MLNMEFEGHTIQGPADRFEYGLGARLADEIWNDLQENTRPNCLSDATKKQNVIQAPTHRKDFINWVVLKNG
jgi:hypothetical protein